MNIEERFLTLNQFCRRHRYNLAKNLVPIAEQELRNASNAEGYPVLIKINRTTGKSEYMYSQAILEDYFKFWL